MFQELTPRANKIIHILAKEEAKRLNHTQISPEHIILGMIKDAEGIAVKALINLGTNLNQLQIEIEMTITQNEIEYGINLNPSKTFTNSPRIEKILKFSAIEAENFGHSYIGTEHLLLGILKERDSIISLILENKNITIHRIRKEILKLLGQIHPFHPNHFSSQGSKTKKSDDKMQMKTPTLDEFSRDLTLLASKKQLEPIIGRQNEIQRLIQILSRKKKNNPILISEPGVGKTAIVEGLAQYIVQGKVSEILLNKRILSLDLALIVAGTKYRGEFEERLKNIIKEIRKSKNIILFIDEVHTLIGAGGAEGAIDAANMLKPPLSEGQLQCIGATTFNEYKKYIEKDSALERRFQPILVEEPNLEEAKEILKGLRSSYEEHHKVIYLDESLDAAVELSKSHIYDRHLPDKAIDLIDEAGAKAHLKITTRPSKFSKIEKKILNLAKEKDLHVKQQDYEKAAKIRDEVNLLKKKYHIMVEKWKKSLKKDIPKITKYDISKIVSSMTGIPLHQIQKEESEKLLQIEKELGKLLIGQKRAVKAIASCIRRSRLSLNPSKKPLGSFLFLGPTGVGKTHLAKSLSKVIFNHENLIRLDMSEFMEKFSISRIIGAPPGYVGYSEGGELTQKIRRKPYSVILIDEIEKAHPEVLNFLLQVLEEGELTDSVSSKIKFNNAIIIMTSNIGAKTIFQSTPLGFMNKSKKHNNKAIEKKVFRELNQFLNPELINRIDEKIVFHPLEKEDTKKIFQILLAEFQKALESKKIFIKIEANVIDYIINKTYNRKFGARPVKKALQKYIEDPLTKKILKSKVRENIEIAISFKDNKFLLSKKILSSKKPKINNVNNNLEKELKSSLREN